MDIRFSGDALRSLEWREYSSTALPFFEMLQQRQLRLAACTTAPPSLLFQREILFRFCAKPPRSVAQCPRNSRPQLSGSWANRGGAAKVDRFALTLGLPSSLSAHR